MRIKCTRLDLNRTRASWTDTVFNPAFVSARSDSTRWIVADSAVNGDSPILWADAAADEYIRIPLFQYKLPPKGDNALTAVFQLGLIVAMQVGKPIVDLHVVTADPVELIRDAAGNLTHMSYWFGFALSVE